MRWRAPGAIFLSVLLLLGWCHFSFPTYTYRYRLDVEFSIDGEPRIASTIREERVSYGYSELGVGRNWSTGVRGEAALLDLGDRGYLLATFSPGHGGRVGVNVEVCVLHG